MGQDGEQRSGGGLLGAIQSLVGGRKREAAAAETPAPAAPAEPAAGGPTPAPWEPGAPEATMSWFAPQCSVCKKPMLLRAHDSADAPAGQKYWACSHVGCDGRRELKEA